MSNLKIVRDNRFRSCGNEGATRNELLLGLGPGALYALLSRAFKVEAGSGERLVETRAHDPTVFFPESGIVAVTVTVGTRALDVSYAGRESMAGPNPLLLPDDMSTDWVTRSRCSLTAIPLSALVALVQADSQLQAVFGQAAHSRLTQAEATLVAAAFGTIRQRLARWLISYTSRMGRAEIECSHELIGRMLGVRRSSVTTSLHELEGAGAVRSTRGIIIVRNRAALSAFAAGLEEPPNAIAAQDSRGRQLCERRSLRPLQSSAERG